MDSSERSHFNQQSKMEKHAQEANIPNPNTKQRSGDECDDPYIHAAHITRNRVPQDQEKHVTKKKKLGEYLEEHQKDDDHVKDKNQKAPIDRPLQHP